MTAAHSVVADPYLSVVVTARNDDHGGDPLYRMQAFVDSLLRQCDMFRLPAELVVVEWNPPDDRVGLAEALQWGGAHKWCDIRFIQVPHDLHSRLENSEALPLFQMIAKNVGIRRARGRFVLATNIDLLFADDLVQHIAKQRLEPGTVYRVDRHDIPGRLEAAPEQWLEWSRRSVIRVHTAHGSVDTRTGEYFPVREQLRIGRFIRARVGRHPEWQLRRARAASAVASFAAGLPLGHGPARLLRRTVRAGRVASVALRHVIWLAWAYTYWFWCGVREPRLVPQRGLKLARRIAAGRARRAGLLHPGRPPLPTGAPAAAIVETSPVRQGIRAAWEARRALPPVHTNTCGDFTLMARSDWDRLEGYPEVPWFSMHVDGLLLYQAFYAGFRERILPYPIYHLEHGSGFRPDEASIRELDERLERDRIRQIRLDDLIRWALEMHSTRAPLEFNDDDWGLRDETLVECRPLLVSAAR